MKKRKLNSTNPKYHKVKEEEVKERKDLIATIRKGRNRDKIGRASCRERV